MRLQLGLAIGTVLLLAGCGDEGGSEEPAPLSGVFKAGNVMGVHYRTPTQDGLTDASGTFKYVAGETVTFSVGGIRMGSAPGAETITPFTLAGVTPPTTETALRLELDRASRTTSAFVRAANIQRFLLALDADHDPDNGIDVRRYTSTLANSALDFNLAIPAFAAKLDRLAPNLTHNLPRWYPIVHLYRSLGIVVPAHVPVESKTEQSWYPAWGTVITYYPNGLRESQDSFETLQGGTYSQKYRYDAFGRQTWWAFESWNSLSIEFLELRERVFDERGTLTQTIANRDEGRDGLVDFNMVVAHEYGDYNNLLSQQTRNDAGNDGTVDSLSDYRSRYDDDLNIVRTVSENDANADGVVDSRWIQTIDYDTSNRPVLQLAEFDGDADGTVDVRESWKIIYDLQGRGAEETYQRDEDVDGVYDYILTYRWTYDGGRLRTLEIKDARNFNANGPPQASLVQTLTYDDDARVLSENVSQDWDGVGGFDVISRTTYTYTDFGSPRRQLSESDGNADGVVDARYATDYEYGTGGELLSMSSAYVDNPNFENSTDYTNTLLPNGVLALAQQYFEFTFSSYVDATSTF